jgi:hypothetical protein
MHPTAPPQLELLDSLTVDHIFFSTMILLGDQPQTTFSQ